MWVNGQEEILELAPIPSDQAPMFARAIGDAGLALVVAEALGQRPRQDLAKACVWPFLRGTRLQSSQLQPLPPQLAVGPLRHRGRDRHTATAPHRKT